MVYEAVAVEKSIIPAVRRTVGSTAQISKGALLALSSPNTVANSATDGTAEIFGGVAAADKASADGRTNLGAHYNDNSVWDLRIGGTISMGAYVMMSGANIVAEATPAAISTGLVVGRIEEEGVNAATGRVRLMS